MRSRTGLFLSIALQAMGLIGLFKLPSEEPLPKLPHPPYLKSVTDLILDASLDFGIPPHIALRRAWYESGMEAGAIRHERNGSVSRGIMQLNSRWYPPMSVEANIREGVQALANFYRRCGGDEGCTHRSYRHGHLVLPYPKNKIDKN